MAKKPKKAAAPEAEKPVTEGNIAAFALAPSPVEGDDQEPAPEPKPVPPEPETHRTVNVVYMPGPEGPDETAVAGVAFRAYEPVAVNEGRNDIIKLHQNPWFGAKVDPERQKAWRDYRDKQEAARKAREELDSLL